AIDEIMGIAHDPSQERPRQHAVGAVPDLAPKGSAALHELHFPPVSHLLLMLPDGVPLPPALALGDLEHESRIGLEQLVQVVQTLPLYEHQVTVHHPHGHFPLSRSSTHLTRGASGPPMRERRTPPRAVARRESPSRRITTPGCLPPRPRADSSPAPHRARESPETSR